MLSGHWQRVRARAFLVWMTLLLAFSGPLAGQKDKPKASSNEFDKVVYLYGPTAKQARDALPGESAKGTLRFDPSSRALAFTASKAPGFRIPYDKIQKFESQDASLARQGSFLVAGGAGVLMIRQKKHFLTILYTDDQDKNRSALLQLDKDNFLDVLTTVERETGLTIGEPRPTGQKDGGGTGASVPPPASVPAKPRAAEQQSPTVFAPSDSLSPGVSFPTCSLGDSL